MERAKVLEMGRMSRTWEVRGGGAEQATYPKNGGECNLTKGW